MPSSLIAQNTNPTIHYYYIEEASTDLLKTTSAIEQSDSTLDLQFNDPNITNFFNQFDVYSYVREFEWSKNIDFHKYYLVGMDSDTYANVLLLAPHILFAEYIGKLENKTLGTPNDYFDHANIPSAYYPKPDEPNGDGFTAFNVNAYEHLDLVNARQAWNITTGIDHVEIGIVDVQFDQSHDDLFNKISQAYGAQTANSSYSHGVHVSGVAAADTNNNTGIASIGYDSNLVTINNIGLANSSLFLAENHPNLKVINISMGSVSNNNGSDVESEIYDYISNSLGVTVVAAAGNGWASGNGNPADFYYPASYESVISVSSVGSQNEYGFVDENDRSFDWKDVHLLHLNNTNTTYSHQHNNKVDIVAPGYSVAFPTFNNNYRLGYGTSYASPMVAGVAALMYSVHPTITPTRVKEILQETAVFIDDIPENIPYAGLLGAGRVNAYAAVLQAKCDANFTPGLDLMMQNSEDDFGVEPDVDTDIIWDSPDIWVRNQDDGILYQTSQDLHFVDNQTPVYVYVKVTNNSCETSTGNEVLNLYWAKGGLSQQWPNVWEGNDNLDPNTPIGNPVNDDPVNIPSLAPGESTILEFPWQPLDPGAYANLGFEKPWMFCFLSRIVTSSDPMTFTEGANAALNTRNNNNIAYKNATVINVAGRPSTGSIVIGNIGNSTSLTSDIEFFTNTIEDDNLWQDAEVRLELSQDLWNLWQNSGAQFDDVRVLDPAQRLILLTANNTSLNNIAMQSNEWGIATLGINFLINQVDAQEDYSIHVQQVESATQEVLGGFSYTFLRDNQRQAFNVGTNRVSNTDGSETFYVEDINEEAIYNWYDEDGVLIYSGSDFTVSNMIAKEYKLEVIAETDGHKDYKTVETEDKRIIESISPNPATTSTFVTYQVAAEDNAYVRLTNSISGVFNNYILDSQNSSLTIPTQNLVKGTYVVNLIANGVIIDAKQLIIN